MIDLREYIRQEEEALDRVRASFLPADKIPVLPDDGYSPRRGLIALDNDFHADQEATFPVPLATARQQISRAVWEYCQLENPAHMLLVPAPAGFGKTHLAARTAERLAAHRRRVFYAGPRHDFFNDVQKEAERPHIWYPWQPHQLGDEEAGKVETCYRADQLHTWAGRGHMSIEFCKQACGWKYLQDDCVYHAQRNVEHPIIYGMHEHLWLGHPLLKTCTVVVGDEYPIKESTYHHKWRVPAGFIVPRDLEWDSPVLPLLLILKEAAERGISIQGTDLLDALGGAQLVSDRAGQIQLPTNPALLSPMLSAPEKVEEETPYAHFVPLLRLLLTEAERHAHGKPFNARVIVHGGELQLLTNRPLYEHTPKHMIWLDATANTHLYETAFNRPVVTVDIEVEPKGRIFQVWNRGYGKASLDPKANETDKGKTQAERYQVQARQEIGAIVAQYGYRNAGIITFKDVEAILAEGITDRYGHFYANRGTNEYNDVDVLFVVGTPQPDILGMVEQAKMMWADRHEPFVPIWSERTHQYPKHRYAYAKSGFWHDKDLNAILWQSREAELIQSVNRARILTRNADVWLLSNLPIAELAPTELVSMAELFNAPPGVNRHAWATAVEAAQAIIEEKEFVTAKDLAERVKCSQPTADKYLTHFVERLGWQEFRAVTNQRGPKPRAVSR